MAKFTAGADLNIRLPGGFEIVGAAGATHRIPDSLAEEFARDEAVRIPGFAWVTQDETTSNAGLDLKYDKAGGTISGAVTATGTLNVGGAATLSSTLGVTGLATLGSVIASAVTATTARFKGGPWFDVRAYGATGDGTTDDTASIEAASLALSAAGGGVLYFPPGTYLVSFFDIPGWPGYKAGVIVRTGCTLVGAGIGASTIKLKANEPSYSSAGIVRNGDMDGGDERVGIVEVTIDGNGASQSTLYQGVDWQRVRGARHERVRVLNIRGTAAFPPGETTHFNAYGSSDIFYTDCEAIGTAGTQGSGFAANYSTNIVRTNCIAHGMSAGMGFADYYCRGVRNINCVAQRNGTNGFNIEYCEDYFVSGRAGGRAASGTGNYPWAADTSLGNTGDGVTVNATKRCVVNVNASYNGGHGLDVVPTGTDESQCQVVGGYYVNNTGAGIRFGNVASARLADIADSVVSENNTLADLYLNGGVGSVGMTWLLSSPAVPASGTALTNNYPFPVTVYVMEGTLFFISVDGVTLNATGGTGVVVPCRVRPGGTIQINYSAAPTWIWSRR